MDKKKIIVKYDSKGVAYCIGKACYCYVTYFYHGNKKLKKPVIRCCAKVCFLDKKSTIDINKEYSKYYPIVYIKPPVYLINPLNFKHQEEEPPSKK